MKTLLRNNSGFTLVELLVVIGVLGVLAAGLLATIDPLEQFRKATDSNRRSASLELVNAITRYYAARQALPWDSAAAGGAACNGGAIPASSQVTGVSAASTFGTCITELTAQGELKSTYATQYGVLNKLYITETSAATDETRSVAVCFNPESKSMSRANTTLYSIAGAVDASCDTEAERAAANAACFYCSL